VTGCPVPAVWTRPPHDWANTSTEITARIDKARWNVIKLDALVCHWSLPVSRNCLPLSQLVTIVLGRPPLRYPAITNWLNFLEEA